MFTSRLINKCMCKEIKPNLQWLCPQNAKANKTITRLIIQQHLRIKYILQPDINISIVFHHWFDTQVCFAEVQSLRQTAEWKKTRDKPAVIWVHDKLGSEISKKFKTVASYHYFLFFQPTLWYILIQLYFWWSMDLLV